MADRGGRHAGEPKDPERAERLSLHRAILSSIGASQREINRIRAGKKEVFLENLRKATGGAVVIDSRQYDYLKEHRLGREKFGPDAIARAWVASRGEGYWSQWYRIPHGGLDKALFRYDMFVQFAQSQGKDSNQFYNDLESAAKVEHLNMKRDSTLRYWATKSYDSKGRPIRDKYGRQGKGLDVWRAGDEGGSYWETP